MNRQLKLDLKKEKKIWTPLEALLWDVEFAMRSRKRKIEDPKSNKYKRETAEIEYGQLWWFRNRLLLLKEEGDYK